MAKSLQDQHPDVTKIVWKWGRWQHQVDYSFFKKNNQLELRENFKMPEGINEYGMKLVYPLKTKFEVGALVVFKEPYIDKNLGKLDKFCVKQIVDTKTFTASGAKSLKVQLVKVDGIDKWLDPSLLEINEQEEK